ncbi:MAG: tetratricopeptide repeat protein, partial [bacterium]
MNDLPGVVSTCAINLIKSFNITILPPDRKAILLAGTQSISAFNKFSKGTWDDIHYIGNNPKKALKSYENSLTVDLNFWLGWLNLAKMNYETGNKKRAVNYLEDINKKDPEYVYAKEVLASVYSEAGYREKAKNLYMEILKINPDMFTSRFNLAKIFMEQNNFKQAASELKMCAEVQPKNISVWLYFGKSLLNAKSLDGALGAFEKIVALEPNNAEAYYNIGLVHTSKRDYVNAIRNFNQAKYYNPESPDISYELCKAYIKLSNYKRAKDEIRRAIKLDSSYALLYKQRGILYFIEEAWENAMADFLKYRETYPDDKSIDIYLAESYAAVKQYEMAYPHYKSAEKTMKHNVEKNFRAALTFYNLGHKEQVIPILEKVVKNDS